MPVVWDSEHGSHRLEEQPAWPPMGVAGPADLPEDVLREVGAGSAVWLQPRADGTAWIYETEGRLLGIKTQDQSDHLLPRRCSNRHRYLRTAKAPGNCPVCKPPEPIVPGSTTEARRRKQRLASLSSFALLLPVLSVGAWLGDRYYERSALDALLTEVEAIERAEVWDEYFEVVGCGGPIAEEPASRVITQRAPAITSAAIGLAEELEHGVARIQDVRIAPWHRDVERARDRIRDYERAWIEILRTEANTLKELDGVTHRAHQKKILDPYAEWFGYVSMSIDGTFYSAQDAFNDAVVSAGGTHRARVDVVFDPDTPLDQMTCPGDDL